MARLLRTSQPCRSGSYARSAPGVVPYPHALAAHEHRSPAGVSSQHDVPRRPFHGGLVHIADVLQQRIHLFRREIESDAYQILNLGHLLQLASEVTGLLVPALNEAVGARAEGGGGSVYSEARGQGRPSDNRG